MSHPVTNTNLTTCRFCGMSNFERNHPAERSPIIRYGVRHYAHLKCFTERKGFDAACALIAKLPKWKVKNLPFFELEQLGLLAAARAALEAK